MIPATLVGGGEGAGLAFVDAVEAGAQPGVAFVA